MCGSNKSIIEGGAKREREKKREGKRKEGSGWERGELGTGRRGEKKLEGGRGRGQGEGGKVKRKERNRKL